MKSIFHCHSASLACHGALLSAPIQAQTNGKIGTVDMQGRKIGQRKTVLAAWPITKRGGLKETAMEASPKKNPAKKKR